MAILKVSNVAMRGISACVPKKIVKNDHSDLLSDEELQKFVETVGVQEFRVAEPDVCTSDLAIKAAEVLIEKLNWNKDEIEAIVFVSQTPDYILPITSALIQNKLGLSKECVCIDMMLGCSGFTYGMSVLANYLQGGTIKKGLLVCGDTLSKCVSPKDKSTALLFGDAATVAAFEHDSTAKDIFFHLGSDGKGSGAIMIKDGAARNVIDEDSLIYKSYEHGIMRNDCQLFLDGMEVFSFGITQAPKTCNKLLSHLEKTVEDIDMFVFHQANLMMNEMIRKKLKIAKDKNYYSLSKFGNTSSASIPMTVVHNKETFSVNENKKLIFCGFGVGLSWATTYIETNNLIIPDIIEL